MAVVLDNANPVYPGHFTLILWYDPMRDPPKNQVRELAENEHQLNNHVLTVTVSDDCCGAYGDVNIGDHGHSYRTFPLVAAQFQFHSMWMNATATMKEDLDNEDTGVAVFYNHLEDLHQPEDMLPLFSCLIAADYDISRMRTREVHRLYRLFESVLSVRSLEEYEYDDAYASLEVGSVLVGVVETRLRRCFDGDRDGNCDGVRLFYGVCSAGDLAHCKL